MEGLSRGRKAWPALASGAIAFALWASAASAATITVNTTEDLVANNGHCSLREAITAANTDKASGSQPGECPRGEGPDTIVLPAGEYRLTLHGANEDANATGDLDLTSNITIEGAGAGATKIDGDAAAAGEKSSDRVIQVLAAPVTIDGVAIEHGRPTKEGSNRDGGGILIGEGSTVELDESAVNNNAAGEGPLNTRGGNGGGIANLGQLTIFASEVDENATGPSFSGPNFPTGIGGGIWNAGTLTVEDSVLFENSVTLRQGNGPLPGGGGGAIANAGPSATIDATTLSTNSASEGGEGGSGAPGGEGGAILSTIGTLTVTGSAVIANSSGAGGGAIGAAKGGDGGGVAIKGGDATFVNDTFNGNATGPGGVSDGNPALPGGDGGSGSAIAASAGALSIASLTIADNLTGLGGAGGPGNTGVPGHRGSGALRLTGAASASVQGTIFADNEGGNCSGSPSDDGHNIAFGGSGCPAGFSGGDPVLGPLQDNGGPTSTMALGTGSAALDQLPAGSECPGTDQRGVTRPQGPACDIGAFEFAPTPPAAPGGSAPPSSPGTTPILARRVAPVLSALSLSPAAFRAAPSGASVAKKRKPSGTTISYNDSDAATTTFTVLRSRRGVRKNGRCVAPPKHGHGGRPCTRFVKVGTFTHADHAGHNSFRFTGRVAGGALKPGGYQLEATPRLAGLSGAARSARFTIKS